MSFWSQVIVKDVSISSRNFIPKDLLYLHPHLIKKRYLLTMLISLCSYTRGILRFPNGSTTPSTPARGSELRRKYFLVLPSKDCLQTSKSRFLTCQLRNESTDTSHYATITAHYHASRNAICFMVDSTRFRVLYTTDKANESAQAYSSDTNPVFDKRCSCW